MRDSTKYEYFTRRVAVVVISVLLLASLTFEFDVVEKMTKVAHHAACVPEAAHNGETPNCIPEFRSRNVGDGLA